MKQQTIVLFILLVLWFSIIQAQQPLDFNFGIGVIELDYSSKGDSVSMPVYDKPYNNAMGKIVITGITVPGDNEVSMDTISPEMEDSYHKYIVKLNVGSATISTDSHDIIVDEQDNWLLFYYKEQEGYIRILDHTYIGGIWIKKEDLSKQDIRYTDYMSYLMRYTCIPANNITLNLREQPSANSKIIVSMKGELFHIHFTGKRKESWVEVDVEEIKPNSEPDDVKRKYKGWIKAIGDKHFPNIQLLGNIWGC